ncbi:ferritin-like domain-containing protein [Hellea sp.]|nr:ferritin-like domain-containing protein [Hellea sp.]
MTASLNALAVLNAATPDAKVKAAKHLAQEWAASQDVGAYIENVPDTPARPEKPELVAPSDVKRRRLGTPAGRCALLHAVAHIEFNAIDLAADMIARFGHHPDIPEADRNAFIADWISVCNDEARHFGLLQTRLAEFGMSYGDLPAHNGLWEAAVKTKSNFAARLAIAPMVLEARGLDVTLGMIEKLTSVGDTESADILKIIYNDEIGHVAIGARWFQTLARIRGQEPESWFHHLVGSYYAGQLKPPFNVQARTLAGLKQGFYIPLS